MKLTKNNIFFFLFLILFIFFKIKILYSVDSLSFGDSFNYYDNSSSFYKFLSTWANDNFGTIYNRNKHSAIIFFLIQRILDIDPIIFFKIFLAIYIIYSVTCASLIVKKILNKIKIIKNNNIEYLISIYLIFYYTSPLYLQYLSAPDLSLLNSILLAPCIYLVYYNFIENINFKNLVHLIILCIFLYPTFNNILGLFAVFLGIIPIFFIIFKNNSLFFLKNFVFVLIFFCISLPNIYLSISPLINISAGINLGSWTEKKEILSWFIWMSEDSSIFNILMNSNYTGWSDEINKYNYSYYDFYKKNPIGIYYLILGPLSFLYLLASKKFLLPNYKVIFFYICLLVFLSNGANFPFGVFNIWLHENFFLYNAYRSIHILSFSLIFYISLIKIFVLNELCSLSKYSLTIKKININFRHISLAFFICVFLIIFKGNFFTNTVNVKIVEEFKEVTKFINNNKDIDRIISNDTENNKATIWGLFLNGHLFEINIEADIVNDNYRDNSQDLNYRVLKMIDLENLNEANIKLLNYLGISNILVRNDLTSTMSDNHYIASENKVDTKKLYKIFNNDLYEMYKLNNSLIAQPSMLITYE
jgi:hypothetical protein